MAPDSSTDPVIDRDLPTPKTSVLAAQAPRKRRYDGRPDRAARRCWRSRLDPFERPNHLRLVRGGHQPGSEEGRLDLVEDP